MLPHEALSWGGAISLALLVVTRTAVSFQFQSVTPLAPLIGESFPMGAAQLGLLLGVYMIPGVLIAIALPRMSLALGRAGILYVALVMMAGGEAMLLFSPSFGQAWIARLIAGTGGCIIYISTIEITAGLQRAGPLGSRMGLIAASWPIGNALALVSIGTLLGADIAAARYLPLAFVSAALGCILFLDRSGLPSPLVDGRVSAPLSLASWRAMLVRLFSVSSSFALYNSGFIVLTSFSAGLLLSAGYAPSDASAIASMPMWMFLISVPLGGLLPSGQYWQITIVTLGCLGAAAFIVASLSVEQKYFCYALAGLFGGLPTAPMLARARMLAGAEAQIAYSVLFLVFFVAMMALPSLIGGMAEFFRTDSVILYSVGGLLAVSPILYIKSFATNRDTIGKRGR